jgi:hypothetical protein
MPVKIRTIEQIAILVSVKLAKWAFNRLKARYPDTDVRIRVSGELLS